MENFIPGNTLSSIGPWLVGQDTNYQNYTVIQNAINDAHAAGPTAAEPHCVYIKAGQYTENLTLYPDVYLIGIADSDVSLNTAPSVEIIGHHTFSSATDPLIKFQNLYMHQSGANHLFAVTQNTNNVVMEFTGCSVQQLNASNDLFNFSLSGSGVTINAVNTAFYSANHFFSYSGTPSTLAITAFGGSIQALTAQVTSGTALPYTITTTGTNVTMDINNTNGEIVSVVSTYGLIQTNYTNLTSAGGVTAIYTFCNCYTFTLGSGNYSTSSFQMNNCTIGSAGASVFSYPSGANIQLQDCVMIDSSGVSVRNKGSSTFSQGDVIKTTRFVTTSNATPTVLYSIPIPASMSAWVKVKVIGSNTGHTDTTGADISAIIQSTGAAMSVVSEWRNVGASSTGNVDIVTNFGASTLDVTVTGIAATNYVWNANVEFQKVSVST